MNVTRAVLPLERQQQMMDDMLEARLKKLLPRLMAEANIDFWIILCKEYNEDPAFTTLVPAGQLYASRLSGLAFVLRPDGGMEALSVGRPIGRLGRFYRNTFSPQDASEQAQWDHIGELVRHYDPARIGINVSPYTAMADGLSKNLYDKLAAAVGSDYEERFVSAEYLDVRWFETRLPEELLRYEAVYGLAESIFCEGLSRAVITPGVTTTTDVEWWLRGEVHRLGLRESFTNTVSLVRQGYPGKHSGDVIMPGDLVHCDFGLFYLGLATDMQRMVYILKEGEAEAPQGLRDAYAACNRLQDIVAQNFIAGRTGNDIFRESVAAARAEGLRPELYSHPIGYRCHAPGPTIGLWDQQGDVPGRGDFVLHKNSCFALELNNTAFVPEWGADVKIMQEETVAFREDGQLHFYCGDRRKELRCL